MTETIWERHNKILENFKQRSYLKARGYGSSEKAQQRNLSMMEKYYNDGKSMEEIAKEYGISRQMVYTVIRRIKRKTEALDESNK